ncbi:hypothetical protein FHX41_4054 [Actinomadura hallensis]|uniref:Uncharacterized protein n=1 Tax=Actinomadura hallensis TaxID=337895 RepID=A0A543IIE4_9ACTN|nr:hypothetical protein [Actinomadura hallensis]TQM70331.1 hypothetical protein FHX41_4054 [Actinomadura hallensis]HLV73253.1 hypothetical protein [Vulgatibacteraceae bacterium]
MSYDRQPYRTHRRRRKARAGRLGLAGALTGAVGIAAVAAAIVVIRPSGDSGEEPARPSLTGQGSTVAKEPSVPAPRTGPPINFTTPEGYGYSLAAVKAGTGPRPLGPTKAPPSGTTYAYADYVLTNNQRRPVLLDYPADLFMPKAQVPSSAQARCMPQVGIPDDMCTLPNNSRIRARVDGSEPPVDEDGTMMIPAGASYVVRIASELPVKEGVSADDLRLFVWNARYTSDRKGIELAFP